MNPEKVKKDIDYTKLNIGTELECKIVRSDSLEEISKEDSQTIFRELAKSFEWHLAPEALGEIPLVSKELFGLTTEIKIDLCYSILEISTISPAPDLTVLEKVYAQALQEFRQVLRGFGFMIWPFGVAPASSNLFRLPFKSREETTPVFYAPIHRVEFLNRFCHITSQQINIDVPIDRVIPAVNALYKNLGAIIERFANSPLRAQGTLYKEGRYFYWHDYDMSRLTNPKRYSFGVRPVFPPKPFQDFQDFYSWNWQSEFLFVLRNGWPHTFKDGTMSIERFLAEKKGTAITPDGKEMEVVLEKDDIELFFKFNWLDFKPHYDFDEEYTLEEFLEYWNTRKLNIFFEKHCKHAYLEIRPCSPHYENNAMDIPRYFYEIFSNLDEYISKSEKVDWEQARLAKEKALLA